MMQLIRLPLLALALLAASSVTAQHNDAQRPQPANYLSAQVSYGGFGKAVSGGIEYERFLGPSRRISVMLPLIAMYGSDNFKRRVGWGYTDKRFLFAAPGFRFHPGLGSTRAGIAIGASLAAGLLSMERGTVGAARGVRRYDDKLLLAPRLELGMNFQPSGPLLLGWNIALGHVVHGGTLPVEDDVIPRPLGFFAQIGIKVGAAF